MTRPLTVCIVTCDIVGPIRNGGIGTAYYNLAHALARDGHRVTVLYALGQYCENRTIAYWREEYARHGIEFVPLPAEPVQGHSAIKMSYAVYQWLKSRTFDVVHCHEWRGVGFYTALAKRQGLCLDGATLCVGAHSPTLWHLEGMNELADAEALEVDFMERESVARADVLWSPSAHMIAWMRREGWRLPRRIVKKPYILLELETRSAEAAQPGSELVFFGRLETRKGLDLFCDALDRLVSRGAQPASVTFLGKIATVGSVPSDTYLEKRAGKWPFPWKVVSALARDAAMEYLRGSNRIAVLPSRIDNLPYTVLECLGSRIPFVASDTGGIPEMIRPKDRARVLFALTPQAFADRLTAVLRNGLRPAEIRVTPASTLAAWLKWHRALPARTAVTRPARAATTAALPLVSVCITHYNRPAMLAAALESIRAQDYRKFEIVVVDDGSDQLAARSFLASLEPEFESRGWRIVRQPNRYLGAARNAAVLASRGDYILFMDDDNIARPHELSTFVAAARRSGAGILTCFLDVFQSTAPRPKVGTAHLWPFLGAAIAPGVFRNVYGDANAFVRRDVFMRVGGFTEEVGVGCEDWEFFARAALLGEMLEVVPEPLVRYRQSPLGMLQTTSTQANRMRALRPYLQLLPPAWRPLVHLARTNHGPGPATGDAAAHAVKLDHVQNAVIFGSGEAGRLAIGLAEKCGWTVPWIVDNNPAAWDTTVHGLPVRKPESLTPGAVDLVIVASLAGKPAISAQLEKMGFEPGTEFVHFLDPVKVGDTLYQLSLP